VVLGAVVVTVDDLARIGRDVHSAANDTDYESNWLPNQFPVVCGRDGCEAGEGAAQVMRAVARGGDDRVRL
jgi:hypothetical protein